MSCFSVFFNPKKVVDYATARLSDTVRYSRFFHAMLGKSVYLAPSQFETLFVSLAHTDEDVERTIEAAREAFKKVLA